MQLYPTVLPGTGIGTGTGITPDSTVVQYTDQIRLPDGPGTITGTEAGQSAFRSYPGRYSTVFLKHRIPGCFPISLVFAVALTEVARL